MQDKPTFYESLIGGLKGLIKGAAILGGIGAAAGALLGFALVDPESMAAGAIGFAQMGISAGALIGAFTGVAQTREVRAADPQDIINLANISFAQGVEVGRSQSLSKEHAEELQVAASHFREKLAAEKAQDSGIIR